MSYPYQITSLAQYHEVYKQSIENPEKFWGDIAMHFRWKKHCFHTEFWHLISCRQNSPHIKDP